MVHYYKKGHLQQIVGSLLLKAGKITTDLQLQKKNLGGCKSLEADPCLVS